MVTRQENKRRKGGPQRIRLTFESVNGNWHGEALISEILSVHLEEVCQGSCPLLNLGTHRTVATMTDVAARLSPVPGGTNGDDGKEWRLAAALLPPGL